MPLISDHINRVKSKPYFLSCFNTFCGNCPCILEIRMNHDHTDNCTQIRVCTKHFSTAVCDEDWQERICRITEKLCKCINRTASINIQKSIVYHEVQCFHNSHQETACNNCRNNGDKNISQCLDQPLCRVCLGSCHLLQLILAALGNSGNLNKFIVYLIDNSCSQNDLHLSLRKENTFYTFNVLNIFLISL